MSDKDGGPAFPVKGDPGEYYTGGLTLRDWFAGQAVIGLLTAAAALPAATFAEEAYLVADAMLKARATPDSEVIPDGD